MSPTSNDADPFHGTDGERIVVGYHGTTFERGYAILQTRRFKQSKNPWDWLGHGIYFWLSASRAREWATAVAARAKANHRSDMTSRELSPTGLQILVLAAEIRLGRCLDLTIERYHPFLSVAYRSIRDEWVAQNTPIPSNHDLRKELDCAVINRVVEVHLPSTQTVLGHFKEGLSLYEGSSFSAKDHYQLCVRDPSCIRRVFLHVA